MYLYIHIYIYGIWILTFYLKFFLAYTLCLTFYLTFGMYIFWHSLGSRRCTASLARRWRRRREFHLGWNLETLTWQLGQGRKFRERFPICDFFMANWQTVDFLVFNCRQSALAVLRTCSFQWFLVSYYLHHSCTVTYSIVHVYIYMYIYIHTYKCCVVHMHD